MDYTKVILSMALIQVVKKSSSHSKLVLLWGRHFYQCMNVCLNPWMQNLKFRIEFVADIKFGWVNISAKTIQFIS